MTFKIDLIDETSIITFTRSKTADLADQYKELIESINQLANKDSFGTVVLFDGSKVTRIPRDNEIYEKIIANSLEIKLPSGHTKPVIFAARGRLSGIDATLALSGHGLVLNSSAFIDFDDNQTFSGQLNRELISISTSNRSDTEEFSSIITAPAALDLGISQANISGVSLTSLTSKAIEQVHSVQNEPRRSGILKEIPESSRERLLELGEGNPKAKPFIKILLAGPHDDDDDRPSNKSIFDQVNIDKNEEY